MIAWVLVAADDSLTSQVPVLVLAHPGEGEVESTAGKKAKSGIKTPKADVDLIKQRLAAAQARER